MSATIDQRVVEMRFDNSNFEKNVQTSLSTLDRLKERLNFTGASKGLENLNHAAKNVNMNGLNGAIDTVHAKFSALEVMGVTALANITNSAVNAGKRMVKALTIDPVTTGFSEYETKINAIQTIMSNTASKGTTMDDVTRVINELNTYADKTIYNFAEMTRNIGTFTAAGVGLEQSAAAIQGIANLAAASGSTSQQASTAMYQLSQAMAAGTVKLMDWNSVVNAGMGGEKFQEALKATAREHGITVDEIIEKNGSFRESLSEGWISADILNETLNKFTVDGAKNYAESMVASGKYTKEQADALIAEAQAMEDAATKVKTFTQLWDTMKESVQSGWAQTWEIIIGNFEEARDFISKLSEMFGKVIDTVSNARNRLLSGALNSKWDQLAEKIEAAGISTETFDAKLKETLKENGHSVEDLTKEYGSLAGAIKAGKVPSTILTKTLKKLVGVEDDAVKSTDKVTKSTEEMNKVVDEVISGKWGTYEERWKKLAEAGYDWAEVQNLVNKKLDSSVTHLSSLSDAQQKNAEQLSKLSDEQLKSKGYTDEQIAALRELEKAASDGGTSINDLINSIEKPSGRVLLWESFYNILEGIGKVLGVVGDAWNNIFKSDSSSEKSASDKLYGLIEAFHDFTESMTVSEEAVENFRKVIEGLFALWDLSYSVFKYSLPSAIKLVNAILALFGTNILEVAAGLADCVVAFDKWVKSNTMFLDPLNKTAKVIATVIEGVIKCAKAFASLEIVTSTVSRIWEGLTKLFGKFNLDFGGFGIEGVVKTINSFFNNLEGWIKELDGNQLVADFIDGLVDGFFAGVGRVIDAVMQLGKKVLDTIRSVWDEHSPSREAYTIGSDFVLGLWEGLKATFGCVWASLKEFGTKCLEIFKKIDFGKVFAAAVVVSSLIIFKQLVDAVELFSKPVEALSNMLNGIGSMFTSIGSAIKGVGNALEKNINARTLKTKSEAIKNFAIAIGIMAASIYVLSKIPTEDLIKAGIAIGVLTGVLAALMAITAKLNKTGSLTVKASAVVGVAASLVIVAIALRQLSSISLDQVPAVLMTFSAAVLGLIALVAGFDAFTTPEKEASIIKMGGILIKLSLALMTMVTVMKLASKLNGGDIVKATAVIALISVMFAGLVAVSKLAGRHADKAGSMLRKISFALLIMVGVIKLASMLKADEVSRGIGVITLVGLLFAGLVAVSKFAGQHASKAGGLLLKASVGFLVMTLVVKQIAGISDSDIEKGLKVIAAMELLFAGLIAVSYIAGKNAAKAGAMLVMVSAALLVLSGVMFILSNIDPTGLKNAVIAISVLGTMFAGLIAATHLAKDCKSTLIVLTVAIGLLSLALISLSFIDPSSLMPATVAIGSLIGLFAALVVATKFADASKGMKTMLIEMVVIVTLLATIVALLSKIESDTLLTTTGSLSLLMIALSSMMVILSKASKGTSIAFKQIIPMMGVMVGLAAILAALSLIPNPNGLIPISISLSILLGTLVAAMTVLSMIGPMANRAIVPAMLMGVVIGELALILAALSFLPKIDTLLPTAKALSILLIALSAACILLIPIGLTGPAAVIGALALAGVVAVLGVVAISIGELMNYISDDRISKWNSGIEKFMSLLSTLAYGLGKVLGDFIGGFAAGAMSGLPEIGTCLSDFMTNAKTFIDGMQSVDESLIDKVKMLAQAIIALTAADFINGIMTFQSNGSSFSRMGTELSDFMTNVQPFIDGASSLTTEVTESVKNLATAVLTLTAADFLNGIDLFTGKNSLSEFGKELAAFGPYMKQYSDSVIDVDPEAISASANAAKALSDVAAAIPNSGGLVSVFTGDNTLDVFGTGLVSFGKSIKDYSDAVSGIESIDPINRSVEAAKALVDLSNAIPNLGGLVSYFTGDNDIAIFGTRLVSFAGSLKSYLDAVSGIESIDPIKKSVEGTQLLVDLAGIIPESGMFITNDFSNFAKDIEPLGTAIKEYSASVSGLNLDNINNSVSAIKTVIGVFDDMSGIDTDGVESFKKAVNGFSETNIGEFFNAFSTSSVELEKTGSNLISSITEGIKSKTSNLINSVADAINNSKESVSKQKPEFKVAGIELMSNLNNGISSQKKRTSSNISSTFSGSIDSIEAYYDDFYSAGSHLVSGFANGIGANSYKAAAKARAMAAAAASAAKDELDEHSPSKVGYEIGDFFGIAFVNALGDYAYKAYSAGREMASSAKSGLSEAISKVQDILDGNINTQPVIRPVLDLSDVRSGAGAINSMFGMTPSLGVLSNVGSINSMMNHRSQNGVNSDVVSAINKLRKDLGNVGNTSYNINGISYDDGGAVSEAIKVLVRAAKVERRS